MGVTIGKNGFPDVNIFIWYVCGKLCTLVPLCIWFMTCGHWWRYAILSPIVLFTYQLWGANQNFSLEIDNYEYIRALPMILILVLVLILISKDVQYQAKIIDIYENLSAEIEVLLNKLNTEKSKAIKSNYQFGSCGAKDRENKKSEYYLINLNQLKNDLLNELDQSI